MNLLSLPRYWTFRPILLLVACCSFFPFRSVAADSLAVASITTGRAETREFGGDATPAPGTFILHRTGSTDHSLTVFLAYEGTATPGADYVALNRSVVVPAGSEDLTLEVKPINDTLVEGDETVIAKIIPPLTAIVPSYTIDPNQNTATVIIHDDDQSPGIATITITNPVDGAELPAGVDVDVTAVAVDPNGYIPRVEFHLDGTLLGISEINFLVAPKPGTPITHHVTWKNPLPGAHLLTANGVDASGNAVKSPPLHVTVNGSQPASATLKITSPADGAVFPANNDIPISAVAIDPNGYIAHVDFYANDQFIGASNLEFFRAPDPGTPITHQIIWSNAPAGTYSLTARAIDSAGNKIISPAVHVMVVEKEPAAFAQRTLPSSYTPGEQFEVTLTTTPPLGTKAYALEDTIPAGWTVIGATQDGVFDPATGAVKFGPFFDDKARTLTYRVGAPKGTTGEVQFKGTVSADGVSSAIGGDSNISASNSAHPADLNNDRQINIDELTAYAAAWKSGADWTVTPASIPLSYVTRAAFIWRNGEAYHYDKGAVAPLCWVPDALGSPVPGSPASTSRSVQVDPATGNIKVTLQVQPPAAGGSFALEETLPAGCAPISVGNGGTFVPIIGAIRWGPFFEATPITVSYLLPGEMSDLSKVVGKVGVDGEVFGIDTNRPRITTVERGSDSAMHLKITGPDTQAYVVESSADLINWTEEAPVFLPNGSLDFTPGQKAIEAQRYYRLRTR